MEYIENMAAALLEKRLARLRVKNKIAYTAIVSIVLSGFIVLTIFLFGHGNYFKGSFSHCLIFALFLFIKSLQKNGPGGKPPSALPDAVKSYKALWHGMDKKLQVFYKKICYTPFTASPRDGVGRERKGALR